LDGEEFFGWGVARGGLLQPMRLEDQLKDQRHAMSLPSGWLARILKPMAGDSEMAARLAGALASRPEILEAYLFGSQARGDAQPHSDVDVAVYLDPTAPDRSPFGADAEIAADLMAALGRNDVEVVLLNRADPVLYHRVLRDGIRLFSRDLAKTTTREGRALSRYCDYVPQLAKIRAARETRWNKGEFGQ